MALKKWAQKYPVVMRFFLGFVLLWFGVNEVIEPRYWSGYVPPIAAQILPIPILPLVQIHGIILCLLGLGMFFRILIRITGFITMGILLSIISGLIMIQGFSEIVVRDIGLFGLALAIWLHDLQSPDFIE